jgi:hypothetical protein
VSSFSEGDHDCTFFERYCPEFQLISHPAGLRFISPIGQWQGAIPDFSALLRPQTISLIAAEHFQKMPDPAFRLPIEVQGNSRDWFRYFVRAK